MLQSYECRLIIFRFAVWDKNKQGLTWMRCTLCDMLVGFSHMSVW